MQRMRQPQTQSRTRTTMAPLLTMTRMSKTMELLTRSDNLLAAALAAVTGTSIVTYAEFQKQGHAVPVIYEKLHYSQLMKAVHLGTPTTTTSADATSHSPASVGNATRTATATTTSEPTAIKIFIRTLTDSGFDLTCDKYKETVSELKGKIEAVKGIPSTRQRLIFAGKELADGHKLVDYKIGEGDTIDLVQRPSITSGVVDGVIYLPENLRSKRHDFDFANITDTGVTFHRGPFTYQRPIGWTRVAINVLDRFGADGGWLGVGVARNSPTDSVPDEWPVSYHGTGRHRARTIAEEGYRLIRGQRFAFGRGIYTTPDIQIAELFSTQFTYEGSNYKVVMQNRVNPQSLKRISIRSKDEYWINEEENDVRPYGICIKEVN